MQTPNNVHTACPIYFCWHVKNFTDALIAVVTLNKHTYTLILGLGEHSVPKTDNNKKRERNRYYINTPTPTAQ